MSSTRTMRANGQMGVRRLLTPEEAGGLLGVSAERVTSWCRKGILPGLRMGRIWRIDRQELEGWLRKGRGQNCQGQLTFPQNGQDTSPQIKCSSG